MGNEFVVFTINIFEAASEADLRPDLLLEHPEDLGVKESADPASIWQLAELKAAAEKHEGVYCMAFFQCQFSVDYAKPTRILTTLRGVSHFGPHGWPEKDDLGRYLGPLAPQCGHQHPPRPKKLAEGSWATTSLAAYPPQMRRAIGIAIVDAFFRRFAGATCSSRGEPGPEAPAVLNPVSETEVVRAPVPETELQPTKKLKPEPAAPLAPLPRSSTGTHTSTFDHRRGDRLAIR